jgi:hypothetical protein
MEMKNLTDSELIDMAYIEVRKMDTHAWSPIVISILGIIQSILLIFNLTTVLFFVIFWVLIVGIYILHTKKIKECELKIQEILDELTSRDL